MKQTRIEVTGIQRPGRLSAVQARMLLEARATQVLAELERRQAILAGAPAGHRQTPMSAAEREAALLSKEWHWKLLKEIYAALSRCDEGRYGQCERCRELIPAKRLAATPWARLCRECQHEADPESGLPPAERGVDLLVAAA
ncbi:MAG: TraR/DksA C4-type zinc finger protein [Bryobacteraceae bacterium]